jgi:membrane associated rhomboid family serine protease
MIRRLWWWSLRIPFMTWLRLAAVMTLFALALMVWSLFDPTLIPIIVGMSLAQVFGTLSFAIYGVIVFRDLTRKRRERRASQEQIG